MFAKKSLENSAKNFFLYSYEYHDQKMRRIKCAKQFSQKHTTSASKKCLEKNRRKNVRKSFFYNHTNIVTIKWGKKSAKQFFQKLTNSASKKCWEKNFGINCEKRFFIFTRISWRKNGGHKTNETIFPETNE